MRVYIAGPYAKGDTAVNVRNAMSAGHLVMNTGHHPFIPHLFHFMHMHSPRSQQEWMDLDLEFLPMCDAIVRLPGESSGSDAEVSLAHELNLEIYFGIEEFLAAVA